MKLIKVITLLALVIPSLASAEVNSATHAVLIDGKVYLKAGADTTDAGKQDTNEWTGKPADLDAEHAPDFSFIDMVMAETAFRAK